MHSGELEVYRSLYDVYCPTRLYLSYEGMYARTQLTVMDHNSGVGRQQAKTNKGELRYKTPFSKLSNTWVAKNIMEKKKFVNIILKTCKNVEHVHLENTPKNLATKEYPEKGEVTKAHVYIYEIREQYINSIITYCTKRMLAENKTYENTFRVCLIIT